MPRHKTEWKTADDGLEARVVGPWVERKTHHVDALTNIFGEAMKNKWPARGYVELFSGPGVVFDRTRRRLLAGSPLRALARNFTDYVLVDIDPRATRPLGARAKAAIASGKNLTVLTSDCNQAVADIRAALPPRALSLVFVDPTTWQIRFDSIAALVEGRSMDLLFTFHVGAMRRMAKTATAPGLDAFFSTGDWRRALTRPIAERPTALIELYNRQLEQLHFLPGASAHGVSVKNTVGATMYELVLFARHDLGTKFWREAQRVDERGQRGFWG